ncbi:MAG: hypothetical protein WC444_06960 [Candidatus Paceibacterota bacterium]
METKAILIKIPESEHSFLRSRNYNVSALLRTLVSSFVIEQNQKEIIEAEKRRKEELMYATYTKPEPKLNTEPEPEKQLPTD